MSKQALALQYYCVIYLYRYVVLMTETGDGLNLSILLLYANK